MELPDTENETEPETELESKEVEAVVFLPATPDSKLRKLIQERDEILCKAAGSPTVRFVERGGPTP